MSHTQANTLPKSQWVPWMVWFTAAFFYLYEYIARVAPSVVEHELQELFNVSAGQLGTGLATYYYIYAPMQIIVGLLLDRWGGKRLLVPAAASVAIGCLLFAYADGSFSILILARFLMGLGSAFAFVGAVYLTTIWFPENRIAFLSGTTFALGMFGAVLGESILSRFLELVSWEDSQLWLAAAGLVSVILMFLFIPKVPSWERDRREAMRTKHKEESFVYGLKCVLRNPQSWIIAFVGACLFLPLSVFGDLWGIQYVMKVADISKAQAADTCAWLYLGWAVGSPLAGFLSDKFGQRKRPLLWSTLISGALLWLMLLLPSASASIIGFTLFAVGLTSSMGIVVFAANLESNPSFARGCSAGVTNMIVMALGGLMQAFVGQLLDMQQIGQFTFSLIEAPLGGFEYMVSDYRYALMVMPALFGIAVVVCLFMRETYNPTKYAHIDED